mgnify:CR=1 FL=1
MTKYKVFFIKHNKNGRPVERSRTIKAKDEQEAIARVNYKIEGSYSFYAIEQK